MIKIPNVTPHFYGYDNYPRDEEGKILLDRADDGRIIIKRKNTITIGNGGLLMLCDGAKIAEKDWQDLRRGFYLEEANGDKKYYFCVGGSDAGAVQGVSPYATALDIYNSKKCLIEPKISDKTDYLFTYGHRMEPVVAEGFALRTKLNVFKNDAVFFNERTGFIQANVDYFIRGVDRRVSILEIKTTSPDSITFQLAKKKQVPETYYIQAVLHYPLALSDGYNIEGTYFAIACDNNLDNLQICHFSRNQKGESKLLESEQSFIDRLINDRPPKDTASPVSRLEKSGLKQSESKPIAVDLDKNAKAAAAEFIALSLEEKKLNNQLKPIKKRKEELQAIICQQLGNAEQSVSFTLNNKDYHASWVSQSRITIDKTVLENKYPQAYAETAKESVSRRFNLISK